MQPLVVIVLVDSDCLPNYYSTDLDNTCDAARPDSLMRAAPRMERANTSRNGGDLDPFSHRAVVVMRRPVYPAKH